MTIPTHGFEAEPADVAVEVAAHLDDIADPWERYVRASAAQAHHAAVATALQRERDRALAALNSPDAGPDRLSYVALAERIPGMTPAGVQKAVERGRRAAG